MDTTETTTWPELAIGLFDGLTGRGAEIRYAFENMTVQVPSKAGDGASHAKWVLDGALTITTSKGSSGAGSGSGG
ncbi:hypothetical protein [Phycisphaera mikurensis]|uniref:Uncharacterized protein n=1 Tax=Phycisphaera mikurensis (strain NBRC 102666 / KCTC 22515 / FYK2301M01) TaxID=1142394 RepID=I0IB78_PHYMF|nr:hypothetical protein [Phycisphaera mikurensis]MBB6443014.1 hypothetical protein [Phycisphaera mikurensis]BAM02516.1 hypothetical protein PSMK_03570 [Phycisphaera mikurensis NBRC 102666]